MPTPLQYLKQQLTVFEDDKFIPMWKELSDQDKQDLQDWALEEMQILGVKVEERK